MDVEKRTDATSTRGKIQEIWGTPAMQILIISLVCFCCPGMYNAITGLGGSGQLNPTVAANATVALLATGSIFAVFIAPPVFDLIGPRNTLLLGGWAYPLYSGSLLCYNITGNSGFVIAAGALLGVGAGFLWIAQGAIMVSYPLPDQKGRAIAWFWIIFNLGGGIGSFISFALNYHSTAGTVSNATYGAFIAIMIFGWLISAFVAPPHKVLRSDGTFAAPPPVKQSFRASVEREIRNFILALANWRIICLIPAFFVANFFYGYQQNAVNGAIFTLRTRSLNSAMYWIAQMFGGLVIGYLLDWKLLTRPQRAKAGYAVVFVTGFAIWGGGYAFQRWADKINRVGWLDFSDAKTYIGPFWLYFFYGTYDAFWQSFCYWMMVSIADSPQTAAKFVGLYKSVQSAGGAVAWRLSALGKTADTQFAVNWALIGVALVCAIPSVLAITPSPVSENVDHDGQDNGASEKKYIDDA